MKRFQSATSWRNLGSWTSSAEERFRGWMGRVEGAAEQWNRAPRILTKRAWNHIQNFDEKWQVSSFETRVKVGETMFNSYDLLARQWLGAQVKVVQLKDGPVSYWSTNKPGRETVLFLHGFGDKKEGVYPLAFFLNKNFNVIALDLPGFGKSFRRPDLSHDLQAYSQWLDEFIEAIDMGPAHVVGNSLGGAMAIKLALTRSEIVKSLILLNSAAIVDFDHESIYDEIIRGENPFSIHSLEDFDLFLLRVFHKPPFIPPFVKEFVFHHMRENNDWLEYLVKQNFGQFNDSRDPRFKELFMNDHLHKVLAPTLILWGDKDRVLPIAYGEQGQKLLKEAQFIVLKNVGHAPQVEVQGQVAKHMLTFIAGIETASN